MATKSTLTIRNETKTKLFLTPYKYYNPNSAIITNVKAYNIRSTDNNGTVRIALLRRSLRILVLSVNRMSTMNSVERSTVKTKNKRDVADAMQLLLLYKIRRHHRRYCHHDHHLNQDNR